MEEYGYEVRIKELEERVRSLLASRRMLINLLGLFDREKRTRIAQLEKENRRLRARNHRFAQAILECNARLMRLEQALTEADAGKPDRSGL